MAISSEHSVIKFTRKRDYKFVKNLGRGGCGETVLLYDDIIHENFVCKKYSPFYQEDKHTLFNNFMTEIKLLFQVYHRNVVRAFNYYIYPDSLTGYILMEYINGIDIYTFLEKNPEASNDIFRQVVDGFCHLENVNVLHRDIRPANIMVTEDGIVKIIDLGFGKKVTNFSDFDKSISLNWWCPPPDEFSYGRYDFCTEVYFIGKLFEKIIHQNKLEYFKYNEIVREMCTNAPSSRPLNFSAIQRNITKSTEDDIEFDSNELKYYRSFSDEIQQTISRVENGIKYKTDINAIRQELEKAYKIVCWKSLCQTHQI